MEKIKSNKQDQASAGKEKLRVIPIVGDGNCLYRALSYALYGNQIYHVQIRQNITNYVCDNYDIYEQSLNATCFDYPYKDAEHYKKHMGAEGILGTDFQVAMFANLYEIKIQLYRMNETSGYEQSYQFDPIDSPDVKPVIKILFTGDKRDGHFEILQHAEEINEK